MSKEDWAVTRPFFVPGEGEEKANQAMRDLADDVAAIKALDPNPADRVRIDVLMGEIEGLKRLRECDARAAKAARNVVIEEIARHIEGLGYPGVARSVRGLSR